MAGQPNILFRVNADVSLGLGHVSRCRSLMLALSGQANCRFAIVTDNKDIVSQVLSGIDYELYEAGEAHQGSRFNAVIIDVPDGNGLKENFRAIADMIVCLDDSGPGLDDQDILIRPNLLGLPRPEGMPDDRYWSGQVILHPDFAMESHSLAVEKNYGSKEIMVCFGGSDQCGITLRAINILKRLPEGVLIRIILGAAFPWDEKLALLLDKDERYIVERNVPDVARILRNADIALISGGTLLYEACALGVPSVVICQNEGQLAEADIAHAAGAVTSLGISANVPDENIISAVERLLADDFLRQRMAGAGRSLVSQDGAAQLAARLLSYLRKRGAA